MHFTLSCSVAIAAPRNIINTLNILCCLILQQVKPQIIKAELGFGLFYLKINKSLLIILLLITVHSLRDLTFLTSTLRFFPIPT